MLETPMHASVSLDCNSLAGVKGTALPARENHSSDKPKAADGRLRQALYIAYLLTIYYRDFSETSLGRLTAVAGTLKEYTLRKGEDVDVLECSIPTSSSQA